MISRKENPNAIVESGLRRNHNIDILRAISILLVLIHHFNIPYKLHDTFLGVMVFGESLSTLIARNGNYGVTLFFVISGFLITQHTLRRHKSLDQIDVKDFYIRRVARIFPCLLLLVVSVSLLGAMGLQPFINQSPNGIEVSNSMTIFASLTFWMNILIIEFGWVNYALGVLWSLAVEEVFYLFFPVLCLCLARGKGLVIFLFAIIAYAIYFRSLHFGAESGAYLYHYFSSFDAIAMGCLSALLAHKIHIAHQLKSTLLILSTICMCIIYFYAPIKLVSTWSMTVFALSAAVLIFTLDQLHVRIQPLNLIQRVLVWTGQRSYEMYLFHLLVLGFFKLVYLPKQTLADEKIMLLPLYFILTFILAWLIERYYATPLNHWIRTKFIK